MLRRTIIFGSLVVLALAGSPAQSQAAVSVNIGINLPAPPSLVVVPGTEVQYAPTVSGNYFFYGGQYYVFTNNVWYVGPRYNGPWTVTAPGFVPRPILSDPVKYYRTPPPPWRAWHGEQAPRWNSAYGRDWDRAHGGPHGDPHGPHEEHHDEHR